MLLESSACSGPEGSVPWQLPDGPSELRRAAPTADDGRASRRGAAATGRRPSPGALPRLGHHRRGPPRRRGGADASTGSGRRIVATSISTSGHRSRPRLPRRRAARVADLEFGSRRVCRARRRGRKESSSSWPGPRHRSDSRPTSRRARPRLGPSLTYRHRFATSRARPVHLPVGQGPPESPLDRRDGLERLDSRWCRGRAVLYAADFMRLGRADRDPSRRRLPHLPFRRRGCPFRPTGDDRSGRAPRSIAARSMRPEASSTAT